MGQPVTEGGQILSPGEMAALGFTPTGPLTAGAVQPNTPTLNEQAIRERVNPTPAPVMAAQPAQPWSMKTARTVDPNDPGIQKLPGPLDYMAGNAVKNAPLIGGMAASAAVPGSGAVIGPLMRTAAAGAGGAAGAALTGKDPLTEGGASAAGQAGGEVLGGILRAGLNTPLYRKYAGDKASELMTYLKTKIPAFAKYADGEAGLAQAMSIEAQQDLSVAFDKSLKEVIKNGTGKQIMVPADVAKRLGLGQEAAAPIAGGGVTESPAGRVIKNLTQQGVAPEEIRQVLKSPPFSFSPKEITQGFGGSPTPGPLNPAAGDMVGIDAGEAAKLVTGRWRKDPETYRAVVNALDSADLGDPAARAAYKTGQGFRQFMDKAKGLSENRTFQPENTQRSLLELGKQKELGRRGLDDMAAIMDVGKGQSPLTAKSVSPWEKRLMGGTFGELGALATGNHGFGLPFAGGAAAAELLGPNKIYRNVPLGGAEGAFTGGPGAVGGLIRQLMGLESTGGQQKQQ